MNPCTSLNVRIAISGNDLMDQAPEGASINNSNVAVVDWMYASSTINCDSESKQVCPNAPYLHAGTEQEPYLSVFKRRCKGLGTWISKVVHQQLWVISK